MLTMSYKSNCKALNQGVRQKAAFIVATNILDEQRRTAKSQLVAGMQEGHSWQIASTKVHLQTSRSIERAWRLNSWGVPSIGEINATVLAHMGVVIYFFMHKIKTTEDK